MNDPIKHHFSEEVTNILIGCGWYPGRDVGAMVRCPRDFVLFPPAMEILTEFGQLKCGERGPGIECARSTIKLDPWLAEGESDRFELYEKKIGSRLFPLGEVDDGHFFMAVDEKGRIFLVMDFMVFVADDFDSALENLLLGKEKRSL